MLKETLPLEIKRVGSILSMISDQGFQQLFLHRYMQHLIWDDNMVTLPAGYDLEEQAGK